MTVVNFWVAWKPKREVRKNTGIAGSRAMLPGQPCAKFLKLNRNKIHCEKTYLADYSTSFVCLSLINMRTTEKHARNLAHRPVPFGTRGRPLTHLDHPPNCVANFMGVACLP
jgi:hypothetical protein